VAGSAWVGAKKNAYGSLVNESRVEGERRREAVPGTVGIGSESEG
jgi:hypothetical protein